MISTNDSTNFRVHVKSSTGTGFQNLRQKDLESPAIGLLSTKSQHSPVVSNTNFHLAIFRQFDHQAVKFQIHEFHGFPQILRILGSFHVVHVLRKKWGSITDLQGPWRYGLIWAKPAIQGFWLHKFMRKRNYRRTFAGQLTHSLEGKNNLRGKVVNWLIIEGFLWVLYIQDSLLTVDKFHQSLIYLDCAMSWPTTSPKRSEAFHLESLSAHPLMRVWSDGCKYNTSSHTKAPVNFGWQRPSCSIAKFWYDIR